MSARATTTVTSSSAVATERLAAALARALRAPCVVLLDGDLGAGKTTFARGFVRALSGGADVVVQSPTYALARTYPTSPPVHHLDLYRLDDVEGARDLGLLEQIEDDDALVLVEWPRGIGAAIDDARRATIAFSATGARRRALTIDAPVRALHDGSFPDLLRAAAGAASSRRRKG